MRHRRAPVVASTNTPQSPLFLMTPFRSPAAAPVRWPASAPVSPTTADETLPDTLLLPGVRRRPSQGRGRPDPGPLSRGRILVIGSLYLVGLLLAVALAGFAAWEFIVWTERAFLTQGTTEAWLRFFLAKIALVYGIRWIVLVHTTILEFIEEIHRPEPVVEEWPFVTVLLPAYNEREMIGMTIESVLSLDYPHFELIVIDDGSTDDTFARASAYEGTYEFGQARVLTKANGGKWTAHNFGFRHARGEFVMCIDADSKIDVAALRHGIAKLLRDPQAGAVAGYTRVMQRHNPLVLLQALEFVIWNGALRIPQSRHGAVTCIPGPMGIFRRSSMQQAYEHFGRLKAPLKPGVCEGPFEGDTFAEDFDLTIAIQLLGEKVLYEPLAACDADCPDSMFALLNQRYRWSRGSLQVLKKVFFRCWRTPEYRRRNTLLWLGMSYVYDCAVFVFAFLAQFVLMAMALLGSADLTMLAVYCVLATLFKFVIALPYLMLHRESLSLAFWVPLFDIYGTYVLGGAFVISAVDELRNTKMDW